MTKFSNKLKNAVFAPFSQFLGQKKFPEKSSSVTHNFTWNSSQNLEKVNDTIPRKHLDRQDRRSDRRMEGRTDPILWEPSGYSWGSKKY